MAEEKKGLITIRGLNWDENEALIKFQKDWIHSNGKEDVEAFQKASALWILDNIYHIAPGNFNVMEVMVIYRATIIRSNEVREDEIKNLPPSLIGISSAVDTVLTAAKSTSSEEQSQTAETATTEAQQ